MYTHHQTLSDRRSLLSSFILTHCNVGFLNVAIHISHIINLSPFHSVTSWGFMYQASIVWCAANAELMQLITRFPHCMDTFDFIVTLISRALISLIDGWMGLDGWVGWMGLDGWMDDKWKLLHDHYIHRGTSSAPKTNSDAHTGHNEWQYCCRCRKARLEQTHSHKGISNKRGGRDKQRVRGCFASSMKKIKSWDILTPDAPDTDYIRPNVLMLFDLYKTEQQIQKK